MITEKKFSLLARDLVTQRHVIHEFLKQSARVRSLVFSVPLSDVHMVSPAGHSQLIESVKEGGVNRMPINEADQVLSIMLLAESRLARLSLSPTWRIGLTSPFIFLLDHSAHTSLCSWCSVSIVVHPLFLQ